ncbi:MAG TPA: efflux RND transporter periplasmic adaptor subunit [Pyrinomonadaceae bacterium]|jgi:HlyD family secretion protein|nr:efflux RND transporter periplasmic adaptor subunit [Pyrinomonadaceae bacterium]
MDVKRPQRKNRKRLRLAIYAVACAVAAVLITFGLSRLPKAAPSVARGTVWPDTVKRGQMIRQVRGLGTLVPEEIRQVAAPVEGRVERIYAKAGETVGAGTVLVELSNPTLQQSTVDVEYQIRSAEAELNNIRSRLESERMTAQAATAQVQSEYKQARIQLDTDEQLAKEGLVPAITLRISRVRVEQLQNRLDIEQKRVASTSQSAAAQMAAQQARIAQLRAQLRLNQEQVASLQVRAGTNGVLQQVTVEVGQQITPGTNIARVADPSSLKAVLQIPETQIKDIRLGLPATIDTRGAGVVQGTVQRIDPAVQNATVLVDVRLDGGLPQGARPDLSVDGTIELERLDNVLYVGRPASGAANSTITLFRIEPDGKEAVRVPVKLGRTSVNTVEVLEGLKEGDTVILSETSQWDSVDRLRLE